jgi:hypothetical protein
MILEAFLPVAGVRSKSSDCAMQVPVRQGEAASAASFGASARF